MEGHILVVLATIVYPVVAEDHHFNYGRQGDFNPSHWKYVPGWKSCGGNRQSPIDINTELFSSNDESSYVFKLTSESTKVDGVFVNNGHAPTFKRNPDSKPPQLQVLSTGKIYDFFNLHFHFGKERNKGSEHSVNGTFYPAEAHLVHVRGKEIVVIGVFISLQEDGSTEPPNAEVKRIIEDDIGNIKRFHETIKAEITPYAVLPNEPHCYTYTGSLTTPPCTEGVLWIILQKPIIMTQHDLDILRALYGELELMSDDGNRRPTQRKDVPDVSVGTLIMSMRELEP